MTQASMARGRADILFADDFDVEDAAGPLHDATPPIIEPTFTADDVAEARESGRAAGLQQAEHGMAAARNRLLAETAAALSASRAAAAEVAAEMAQDVGRAMLAAMATLLPFVCAHQGEREIRAIAAFLLPRLREEPAVAIHVNPAQRQALLEDIATLHQQGIEVTASEAMPPGDVRITWHKGAATRCTAPVLDAVTQALTSLHLLEHDPLTENAHG